MYKKITILAILVFLAQPFALNAQDESLKEYDTDTRLSINSWKNYIDDSPYYFLEESKKIVLNEDWSVDETWHARIKIQKDSARDLGEQKIYYNASREEILDIRAHVETPDGEKHPYTRIQDLDAFQDAPMYSDLKVKIITLPQVNVGSIIDVKIVSRMQHEIIRGQFSRQELYPAEPHKIYRAEYILPKKMNIRFGEHAPSARAVRQDDGEKEAYVFEHKRTMKEIEQFLPPYNEVYGISSFSSMADWGTIADWYRGLVQKNTIENTAIEEKTRQLTAGKTTEKDKARAVLEFLQDNFRYVSMSFGDNAVEPHPTDEIFRNRYGDCKDWSILAKQMLNQAGIKADIVVFQDEYSGDPRWSLPSIALFDHVILGMTVDGERHFVDPQLKHFDFGEFPPSYNNAYLLVIEDDGYRFETLGLEPEDQAMNKIAVKVELDKPSGTVYTVQAVFGTALSNALKLLWNTYSSDGKDMFFESLETRFARGGQLTEKIMEGIEQRYGRVTMQLKINKARFYQKTGNLMIIHEPLAQYFPNPFVDKRRRYPVFVPSEQYFKIYFTYIIPPGWVVDSQPRDLAFSNELVELKRVMQLRGDKLYTLYVFRIKRGRRPAEEYQALRNIFQDYYEKSSDAIVLRKK